MPTSRALRIEGALFAALLAVTGCATPQPYATTTGVLHAGEHMRLRIRSGTVNVYAPEATQPRDAFMIEAFSASSPQPSAPHVASVPDGIVVNAPALDSLLARVPHGVSLSVISDSGDVNVTDVDAPADAQTTDGNVTMMLPAYGSARITGRGSIAVTVGALSWPGTLFFSTPSGDVSLSIAEDARFRVTLLTRHGTIFTDFNLRGTSRGATEMIAGSVNGGGPSRVFARTGEGAIRLLRLAPQI